MDLDTRVDVRRLRRSADESNLDFDTTAKLVPPQNLIGQDRAEEALAFALQMPNDGYNVFVMGEEGAGKHTFVRRALEQHAQSQLVPSDLCYVHRFDDARAPRALLLPAGRGRALRTHLRELMEAIAAAMRAAFDSDDYRARRTALAAEVEEKNEAALEEVQQEARANDVIFMRAPTGFGFAPMRDGEVVSQENFAKLPDEEQVRVKQAIAKLEKKLTGLLSEVPRRQREAYERMRVLDRETSDGAVKVLFDEACGRYADLTDVHEHLCEVRKDVVTHAKAFLAAEDPEEAEAQAMDGDRWPGNRYEVNLVVDHGEQTGAPVVYEDHPTLENLSGRVEHRTKLGNLITDFTMIRAGALHHANGGYLVVDAHKLLAQPQAYEAVKRALRSRQARFETLAESIGMAPAGRLVPDPVPLDAKLILVGDRRLYYLLCAHDPELEQLFKVVADFADDIPRTLENERAFAGMAAGIAASTGLRAFDRSAVARAIEHASRQAEDASRLSVRTQGLVDLLRESDYYARRSDHATVTAEDVDLAIAAQIRRMSRVRDDSLRMLEEGTLLVSTEGAKVGQVNGLSVLALGAFAFGRPTRITCRLRLGRGEIIDIEREVRLGGPLHTKGILILTGFLGARYARNRPLSLSASLVFEQSYGGVDGDSASLAEVCALLSAIAEVPLEQRFGITGSINQMGEVQPIGGVNEKIEGFFDACVARGLTGKQGVIIPRSNVRHLMLDAKVVRAVENGEFSVHAVRTVDEALVLLSGLEVGTEQADGSFPPGTLNARIEARLSALTQHALALSGGTLERRIEVGAPSEGPPAPGLPGPSPD